MPHTRRPAWSSALVRGLTSRSATQRAAYTDRVIARAVAAAARRSGEAQASTKFPEPSSEQALAVAFGHLAAIGFAENMAGHITWQLDGQSDMLVNPWGLWWQELTASDICVVDAAAREVRGRWDVTPAIHIHTELHRVRDDARVVIHNRPYYVCVLAALGAARTGASDRFAGPG